MSGRTTNRVASGKVRGDLTKPLAAIATGAVLVTGLNVSAAEPLPDPRAADLHAGSVVHVESNAIWFTTSEDLAVWQGFRQIFTPKEVETYQRLSRKKNGVAIY